MVLQKGLVLGGGVAAVELVLRRACDGGADEEFVLDAGNDGDLQRRDSLNAVWEAHAGRGHGE